MMKAVMWSRQVLVLAIFGILSFSIVACSDGSSTASTTDDSGDDGGITTDGGALDLSTDSLNFAQITLTPAEPALGLGEGLMALVDGDLTSLTVTGDAGAVIDIDGNTPDCTGATVVITEDDDTEHEAALNADCSFETTFDSSVGDSLTFSLSDGTDQSNYAPISVPAESTTGTDALIDGRAIRTLSGFTAGQELELCTIGAIAYSDEITDESLAITCVNADTSQYHCIMVTADENGELALLLQRGTQYQVLLDDTAQEESEKCAQLIVATEEEEDSIDAFIAESQISGRVLPLSDSRQLARSEIQALSSETAFTVNASLEFKVYKPDTREQDGGEITDLSYTFDYTLTCAGTLDTTLSQLRSESRNLLMTDVSSEKHADDLGDQGNTCEVSDIEVLYDPAQTDPSDDTCQLSASVKTAKIFDPDTGVFVLFETVSVTAEVGRLYNTELIFNHLCQGESEPFLVETLDEPFTAARNMTDATILDSEASILFFSSYPSRFFEDVQLAESGQSYSSKKTSEWISYNERLGSVKAAWSLGVEFIAF